MFKKTICAIILTAMGVAMGACTVETPVVQTAVVIETPQGESPPVVRVSRNNYSTKDMVSVMGLAEESALIGQTVSDPAAYLDSAIRKAGDLKLNEANLQLILDKLVWHVEQLDFEGKSKIGENTATFMLSTRTAQLPYLIEKAKYEGEDAWVVVLNWDLNPNGNVTHGSHVALVAFKYGTDEVLFAMSCA